MPIEQSREPIIPQKYVEWQEEVLLLNIMMFVLVVINLMGFFAEEFKWFVMFVDFLYIPFFFWEMFKTKLRKIRRLI